MCKNPLKRKVASQFLNVLPKFQTHYQHFCKKKEKKVMRHPKVRREGTRNHFVFYVALCVISLRLVLNFQLLLIYNFVNLLSPDN